MDELGTEIIARYQPVASDLRFIQSCLEISYGFSRLGRYALDIAEVLETVGNVPNCDHTIVELTSKTTEEMIRMSIDAFTKKDVDLAKSIAKMDDYVDEKYRASVSSAIKQSNPDIKCAVSTILIMRYLERISESLCIHRRICGLHCNRRKKSKKIRRENRSSHCELLKSPKGPTLSNAENQVNFGLGIGIAQSFRVVIIS